MKFEGIIPPMVTPLDAKRRLDKAGTKKMVKHLLDGGVDGIFLLGTTGECTHLPYAVRDELVKTVCGLVKGRVPVITGITETDMDGAITFAKRCKGYGAAAAVAAPPYYFRLTQKECAAWYEKLADRLPMPLLVYNMPAHTDTVLDPAVIARLAAHPNIAGIKDSSAVIDLFNRYRLAIEPFKDKFSLFMGPDAAMGEAVAMGAAGGVCTGANIWPAHFKAMYLAARKGDMEEVRRLQRFAVMSADLLYGLGEGQSGFLKSVKCALSEMGLVQNVLSEPFEPFEGAKRGKVKAALARLRRELRSL